jgi:RimJ/RimL family protein N-acetyltransferase
MYHKWLQSEEMLELTASEPLSIEEEYDMQKKWETENDKSIFLIMAKDFDKNIDDVAKGGIIGDVNLFYQADDEDGDVAEIDIMIAEKECQRKGYGLEAVALMLKYGIEYHKVNVFKSIISVDNIPSKSLFKNKFNFKTHSISEVFKEETLLKKVDEEFIKKLNDILDGHWSVEDYE